MFRDPTYDSTGALLVELGGTGSASPSFRNPTYNSTTGALLVYIGAAVFSTLTVTGLTSGRVPFITTGGLFTDEAAFAYNSGTDRLTVGSLLMSQVISANVLATDGTGLVDARQSSALSVIGRSANSTGVPADIAAGTDGFVLRRSGTTLDFGTVATAGHADDSVTYAKMQNISAASKLLGRGDSGAGDPQEITLGGGLTMTGTTLAASGSMAIGGTVTGGTDERILFVGGGGLLSQDANLTWNLGTFALGGFQIVTTNLGSAVPQIWVRNNHASGVAGIQITPRNYDGAPMSWKFFSDSTTRLIINDQTNAFFIMEPTGLLGLGTDQVPDAAQVHIGPGSTSKVPFRLTSGSLKTTAVTGGIEFLTDKFYGTITTGAARKEFALADAALTSGRVPFATTNGRLTDHSGLTYDSGTSLLTAGKLTVSDDLSVGDALSVTGLSSFTGNASFGNISLTGNITSIAQYIAYNGIRLKSNGTDLLVRDFGDTGYTFIDCAGIAVNGTFVLGAKNTGWTAPTGTGSKAGFAVATATTADVAAFCKALYDALSGHGIIGT